MLQQACALSDSVVSVDDTTCKCTDGDVNATPMLMLMLTRVSKLMAMMPSLIPVLMMTAGLRRHE